MAFNRTDNSEVRCQCYVLERYFCSIDRRIVISSHTADCYMRHSTNKTKKTYDYRGNCLQFAAVELACVGTW